MEHSRVKQGFIKLQIAINGPNEVANVELLKLDYEYRQTEVCVYFALKIFLERERDRHT